MSRLVVSAHFDVDRTLRAHTRRTIETYAADAERVIVVSTSGLDEPSIDHLPANVEFVSRRNFGYDFYSYKWGLDIAGEYGDFEQILICNDSFIGPTVPLSTIFESPQAAAHDVLGMTMSHMHGRHAQSFFVIVNNQVARSNAFRRFWLDMAPISDRFEVIKRYEVGFSKALTGAGFSLGSYFQPTSAEQRLARERYRWFTTHRLDKDYPDRTIGELHTFNLDARPWNPAVAYADRIALDDKLPLLKFDTLRFDPYELGAERLLDRMVADSPELFGDIASFIDATRDRYPVRLGEQNLPASEEELRADGLGYLMDDAFESRLEGDVA